MPRVIKKKIQKKDVAVEIDVKDKLSDLQTLLKDKQKPLVTYGGAAIVVMILIIGVLSYNYVQGKKSRQLEYEAYKVFYSEYQQQTLPHQERFEKALKLFQDAYGKKESARVLLYIANAYYELGKTDDSLKSLQEFTKKYSDDRALLPLAYQKMASIHIERGNKEEALKALDALYQAPGSVYKDFALIESARILESQGKQDSATAKYRELTEKYGRSPFYEEAKSRLEAEKEAKENN